MCKIDLLQSWYGLSDYEVENKVNESISCSKFVVKSLNDLVPDNSFLSWFRTVMTKKSLWKAI